MTDSGACILLLLCGGSLSSLTGLGQTSPFYAVPTLGTPLRVLETHPLLPHPQPPA